MQREIFAPDLESLFAPVPGASPCGVEVRYEQAFLALRQSREEDDPSLPMREWERPLQRADWRAVAINSAAMLARSKDLQLAAWLTDAWTRLHQVDGFNAGVDLLQGLVDRYWDELYPLIEDGDADSRIAAFSWLNESMPLTLRLHLPLLFLPDWKPPMLTLADWERVVSGAGLRGRDPERNESFMRDDILALVDQRALEWLADLHDGLDAANMKWDALARTLDDRLGVEAPSMGKVSDTLRKMQRACVSLMDGRNPRAAAAPEPQPVAQPAQFEEEPVMMPATNAAAVSAEPDNIPLPSGPIANRQEAYRMLEAAAAYLARTEPHSPTPYLVKRAVTWGQMSLADLMQEILREEGDLTRYFSLLGLNTPRD